METPLSPIPTRTENGGSGESYYEDDSLCQNEVNYMDVGVFTQAMNAAVMDLALNGSTQGRQTRRAKREALNKVPQRTKQRRRIIVMDDSSNDGF